MNSVLVVKKVSDRIMSLKMEIKVAILKAVSVYSPQVGCQLGRKRNSGVKIG